jgi:pimeloyl-ACP methyl ester carboxylesterase
MCTFLPDPATLTRDMPPPPSSLVLLHGFASSFEHNWRQSGWVDILADFGCAAPEIDLPGHGSSARPTDPQAYADVESDVFGSLPPQRPIGAVGFSAGADLLLRLAIGHPGHFERIALLGLGDNAFEEGDPGLIVEALVGDDEPENVQARLFRRLASTTGNDPQALSAFLRRPRRPLREADLSEVSCPVLVVLGDRDMVGSADRLVGALPSASLVTLPGVDHFSTPSDFGAIDTTLKFFGLG